MASSSDSTTMPTLSILTNLFFAIVFCSYKSGSIISIEFKIIIVAVVWQLPGLLFKSQSFGQAYSF